MKATKIQFKNGSKVPASVLKSVCESIISSAALLGFITDAEVESETKIDIGLHMRSFRIDVAKIGHNARLNGNWGKSPKGYKRSDVPTWEQRVEFNNLVNMIFDKAKLKARIISGNYTVREFNSGAVTYWPEGGDRSSNGWSGTASPDIVTEQDARDYCNSDDLEAKHRESQKTVRLEQARLYRAHVTTLKAAPFVSFVTKTYSRGKYRSDIHVMTLAELVLHNAKADRWRRIKLTDCTPAHGKSKSAALRYLKVMARLNQAKGE